MDFRRTFDLSVYFVADPSLCGGRDVADVVAAAIRGGATLIQLRNKTDKLTTIHKQARDIRQITRAARVPFLINDYIDVAFNVGADGVHLGQGDSSPTQAREILGRDRIVGLTAFMPAHMAAVDPDIIDYVGTGPFYETQTDKNKPVLGAEGFATLAALAPVPVVGIGGITADNAAAVMQAGASGVAMMRSISAAADPESAARKIACAINTTKLKVAS